MTGRAGSGRRGRVPGHARAPGGYGRVPGDGRAPGGYGRVPGDGRVPGGYGRVPGDGRVPGGYGRVPGHGRAPGGGRRRRWLILGAIAAVVLAGGVFLAIRAVSAPGGRATRPSAGQSSPPGHASSPASTGRPRRARPERLPVGTIGRYAVAQRSFRFTDRSRPSLGPQSLPTVVRYPVIPAATRRAAAPAGLARGQFPLVVFAPGYLQCGGSYSPLLHAWASAGYVVAAVQFPRTNCHVTSPEEDDLVNQPADMAYVIGRLLTVSARSRGVLSGLVNPARIGVAGHSDGGDTVVALAARACCRDRRVTAAVVLAGAQWPPLGGAYFRPGTPPILFAQGSADTINPPAASQAMYQADVGGPRFYLDLYGAGHLTPYEGHGLPEQVVARATTEFLNRYLDGQRSAAAALRRAGNVAGTARLVSGARRAP